MIFLIILAGLYWDGKKQIRQRDIHINNLMESLAGLQMKLKDKERRKAYRLKLTEQKCFFELIDFGDPLLNKLKHRESEGLLKDVSRTGAQFTCPIDLPVRKEIILQIYFSLQDEAFSFKGKIVRKEEQLQHITYGVHFIDIDEAEQQRHVRRLQKMEIVRRKLL